MPRPSLDEACTKIVATVGPACASPDKLAELIESGVDIFRINTAHGSREEHEAVLASIRQASAATNFRAGVLLDLAGPKIRLGQLASEPMECNLGEKFSFVRGTEAKAPNELTLSLIHI